MIAEPGRSVALSDLLIDTTPDQFWLLTRTVVASMTIPLLWTLFWIFVVVTTSRPMGRNLAIVATRRL